MKTFPVIALTPEDFECLHLHPDHPLHRKTFWFVSNTTGKTPGLNPHAPLQTNSSHHPSCDPQIFKRRMEVTSLTGTETYFEVKKCHTMKICSHKVL